jgi:hypothetical protein
MWEFTHRVRAGKTTEGEPPLRRARALAFETHDVVHYFHGWC